MAKKGILVTGGSGLVGAYAVGMLLERGERPVVFDVALNERLLQRRRRRYRESDTDSRRHGGSAGAHFGDPRS